MAADSKSSSEQRSAAERSPYFVVVAGLGIGRAFPIKERTRIGRDPEGEVVLPYWTVSWRHLTVSYRDGVVVAEDLGSRNGTFVGVDKIKRRELAEGDVLAIGDSIALKLCYAPAPDTSGLPGGPQLPREQLAGVANAASLLDRLRTERADERTGQQPIVLVFYRVDGLDEFGELSLVEEAMREVAIVILRSTAEDTLLARAADGELVALSRTTPERAHEMAEEACRRISRQVGRRRSPAPPFVLTAAVVPVAPGASLGADMILRRTRKAAFLALADVSAGVVTTATLGANGGD